MNNLYFEILAFFYLLKHADLISTFKKDFFSEPNICNVFDTAKDFVTQYKVEPTADQIIELLNISGKSENVTPDSVRMLWANKDKLASIDERWLDENVGGWGKWRSFYTGLEKVISYVQSLPPSMPFSDAEGYIEKSKQIFTTGASFTTNSSMGHDFFQVETHQLEALNTRTSGYNFINLSLSGGLFNKSLIVLMGGPKCGKSMWLCNLAAKSVKAGYNTAYITLEMAYQKVAQRIGSNIFNIPINQYKEAAKDPHYMVERMKAYYNSTLIEPGKFIIEERPTSSATASDIEAFLLKLEEKYSNELKKPFKFDTVCIDYINIMKDMKNPNTENTYLKIKSICEDVRAMAQRNDWCVISLTQTNRNGVEASDLNITDVSESNGLVATVDALFGIIRTTMMRAEGVYYLKSLALRDSEHMGEKKRFKFDGSYLRLEEDPTEDIIADGIDIPAVYTSATQHAVEKQKQGGMANNYLANGGQQTTFQQPMFGQSLATAEGQINAQKTSPTDLFAM